MTTFSDIEETHRKLRAAEIALKNLRELDSLEAGHVYNVVIEGTKIFVPEVTFRSFKQTAEAFLYAEIEELTDKLRVHGITP